MKRIGQIEQGPGNDDDVVNIRYKVYDDHSMTNASKERTKRLPDGDCSRSRVLAHGHLQEVDRNATEEQAGEVGDQESTSAVFVASKMFLE